MGEIFKKVDAIKNTIDQEIKAANYFRNANNQFFIGQLRNQQFEIYKKIYTISAPIIKFKPPFGESRCQPGANYIHHEIYEIINSKIFWEQIKYLINIFTPYCKLLDVLQ
ncbi:hypothetical protein C2G38_2228766 [Gigaspora rosea]|uniref:Uncharacterized protein n=1 Tax=Gigaspora rosea TaxID=44941 RepID=A0A397TVH8_9GLOM|nr:hypothetical protein C2G38_2228766 [Gigaspora rosea]